MTRAAFKPFVEPLMRRTLRRADAIIVSDAVLLSDTPLLRKFAEKCHVVPFGIDVSKYDRPAARHHDIKAGRDRGRLVLACGRLVPYKGFDVLIRAAVDRCFEVWIAGEGRERGRLEHLIQSLGLKDRVRLFGSISDSELVKLMYMADVFVMPSVTSAETFGLAQLEAMAAGLPIVNTSLDTAVPHVARHGIEAITVPPGDHQKLAQAIETLIEDPERRERMGRAARQRAKTKYSTDAFKDGIEAIYRDAVSSKAESRSAQATQTRTTGLLDAIQIAATLAWSDMRHRYVRSLLGPFWMSIQMAIMVAVIGSVTGYLSNASALSHLPMLALSLTAWNFLNSVVLDATTVLQSSASLIKDRALPPIVFLLQGVFRQVLFALHNATVPLILWLVLVRADSGSVVAALPGLVLFIACALGLSLVFGALATRFRDMKPIIESTLMLAFLSSPIIWTPEMVNQNSTVMRLNPLTHLFAVWREPLATGHVAMTSVVYDVVFVAVLAIASIVTVVRLRKAAFWI